MIRIGLVTLVVRDYDEAITWFVDRLGFTVHEDTRLSDEKRWVVVGPQHAETRLLLAKATGSQAARIGDQTGGRGAFFLHADDFAATHERMLRAGAVRRTAEVRALRHSRGLRRPLRQPVGSRRLVG